MSKKQHDIFISYSSKDKPVADAICRALEESGIPYWIAPRNAIPGIDYEEQIPPAIKSSQAMVLIFSANSNISKHVQSEVRIAFNAKKHIISFVIDSTQMSDRLDYYLGSSHWLVAYPKYREKTCELVASVCRLLGKELKTDAPAQLEEKAEEVVSLNNYFKGHTDTVYSAAFSPDGTRIVSASRDKTIRIWNAETGECIRTLEGHAGKVHSAAFNTDGTRIVSASRDKTIRIWNAETGECIRPLKGHPSNVRSAAFSPDGTRIVSASPDKTIRIWITRSGDCLAILNEHTHWVYYATFSPDGKRIVSTSLDKTLRIWNAQTGKCIRILAGHTNAVYSAAFSPDGKRIVSASADETLRIWDISDL